MHDFIYMKLLKIISKLCGNKCVLNARPELFASTSYLKNNEELEMRKLFSEQTKIFNLLTTLFLFRIDHPSHSIDNKLGARCILKGSDSIKTTVPVISSVLSVNPVTFIGKIIIVSSLCRMRSEDWVDKCLRECLLECIRPYWVGWLRSNVNS